MADTVVHIGQNSPEYVALQLLDKVSLVEGFVAHRNPGSGQTTATREWILDTYAECLYAVKGNRDFPGR